MSSNRTWHNSAGRPLSDTRWLRVHHAAKEQERTAFAERLAEHEPKRIVDLGCGAGSWLSTLHRVMPHDCEFVGIDVDGDALARVHEMSLSWNRKVRTIHGDFITQPDLIPAADLILLFNMISFASEPGILLSDIRRRAPSALLALRQYDGSTIRFGPMPEFQRSAIDSSLRASLQVNPQFDHYPLDKTVAAIAASDFANVHFEFELYSRFPPFSQAEAAYYESTLDWIYEHLSGPLQRELAVWRLSQDTVSANSPTYICEVDLVALLS